MVLSGLLSRRRADWIAAALLAAAVFAASWWRHTNVLSTNYDLAVVDQVLWKMAHGRGATSSLTAWNAFADHLSPVLLAFVPLYRLAATPLWLFGAQALAVGVSVVAVRPLARVCGAERVPGAVIALLVGLVISPAVWNAAVFDFHTTTLAVPVLMIGITAAIQQRTRALWFTLLALVVLRDDLAIAAAAVAVMGWMGTTRSARLQRMAIIGVAAGWTVIGTKVAEAMGSSRHWETRYGYLGDSAVDAALHLPSSLIALGQHLFVSENVLPLLALLVPLAFLPLGRPAWLGLALALALPVLAADDLNFRSPAFHYGAPLVPFLLAASASTLARVAHAFSGRSVAPRATGRRQNGGVPRLAPVALGVMAAAGFVTVGPPATHVLQLPHATSADIRRAAATIAPDDTVVASTFVGAHLSHRDDLRPFPAAVVPAEWDFPLDPRVTDASAAARAEVDVVVLGHPTLKPEAALYDKAAATLEAEGFTAEDFGTITVYRRPQTQ